MTHPPQQPGQGDPYGRQPGWGQPQPGQYGQQPGWQYPPSGPQQPGYGQQFPPSGPQPQQGGQFPPSGPRQQQPAWGQQPGGQYPQNSPYPGWDGQQQAWGQQPGGFGQMQPPKKSRKGLFIGLGAGGGVVVIGLIVTLVLVFTGGPGSPRPVAQQFVDHMKAKNFSALTGVACEKMKNNSEGFNKLTQGNFSDTIAEQSGVPTEIAKKMVEGMKFDLSLDKVTDHGDNTATAKVSGQMKFDVTIMGRSFNESQSLDEKFNMVVEEGQWKICDSGGSGPL
ncbi:hypothetical protein FHX42_001005 [Saccharopolyspora lacisalsi]|uniref:DUF4878 domain-containing protein n=1 Tax=Halosaccharopolyspora lacisalsi TaxID=1000566 RepID=A0A839DTR6_9PSEU|nr:hypothetical protein [Halosaccharopolyspora lacisalsi]MBA8823676.1 hypothetical protein [Halosaccharopolyspora lacisalsi]